MHVPLPRRDVGGALGCLLRLVGSPVRCGESDMSDGSGGRRRLDMTRRLTDAKRVVVKIGSSSVAGDAGLSVG